jgi:hypothetical protein
LTDRATPHSSPAAERGRRGASVVDRDDQRGFQVRCRYCRKTIFSRIAQLGLRETTEFLEHLKRICRTDLRLDENDTGAILAHFDVNDRAH